MKARTVTGEVVEIEEVLFSEAEGYKLRQPPHPPRKLLQMMELFDQQELESLELVLEGLGWKDILKELRRLL